MNKYEEYERVKNTSFYIKKGTKLEGPYKVRIYNRTKNAIFDLESCLVQTCYKFRGNGKGLYCLIKSIIPTLPLRKGKEYIVVRMIDCLPLEHDRKKIIHSYYTLNSWPYRNQI